jgi:hypothetical protein
MSRSRSTPLLPLWAVWPVQSLSACTKVHFTFAFTYCILFQRKNEVMEDSAAKRVLIQSPVFKVPLSVSLISLSTFGVLINCYRVWQKDMDGLTDLISVYLTRFCSITRN